VEVLRRGGGIDPPARLDVQEVVEAAVVTLAETPLAQTFLPSFAVGTRLLVFLISWCRLGLRFHFTSCFTRCQIPVSLSVAFFTGCSQGVKHGCPMTSNLDNHLAMSR
jgi:hypothetical protein